MSFIKAAVYTPPENSDLPLVAILINPDGEVHAHVVSSYDAGNAIIQQMAVSAANDLGIKARIIVL